MDITNTRRSSFSNTQPTRIKSFCRQNQNSTLRLILPIIYMSLSILYFYNLLSRNVGSGVHVLHDNNIIQSNNTYRTTASIWNGGGKSESPAVQLEPRSLADVTIANAQVAWKRQVEHKNYLRRRAEKREEQRKQREEHARLAQKRSNETAAATVEQANNGTAILHYTLVNGTKKTLVLRTPNNNSTLTKEEEDKYVRRLAKFSVKRTPPNKTGRRRGQRVNGDQVGFLPVLIMITVCTIFRVGINIVIGRLADLSLVTSSMEDGNDTTTNNGGISAFFSGGREARALRRRARAVRAQRQFQRFVDRLNAERESNGERPVTADTLRHLVNSRDFTGNDYDQLHNFVDENGPAAMSYFSAIGATEAEINRLPRRTIEANDDLLSRLGVGGQQQQCSICLEQFQVGETVRTIPCFHTFHSSCIDPWLATKSECPICKHSAIG